jgi:acyl carrier protein
MSELASEPSTQGSRGVTDIFSRVLEIPEISEDCDFFAAGGDSLLATRVLSAVARTYGVELSFDDFLDAPTPDALARKIAWLRG